MSRNRPSYSACVVVRKSAIAKRAVEIVIRNGEAYAFQPRKGASQKVSYHRSGAFHIKEGEKLSFKSGIPRPAPWHLASGSSEDFFTKSLENFESLLCFTKPECHDKVLVFDLVETSGLYYIDVDIIKDAPSTAGWEQDGATETIIKEEHFRGGGLHFRVGLRLLSD